MLDRARDSSSYIEVGTDDPAGLSHLMLVIDPARIHCRPRSADCTADRVSEVTNQGEVGRLLQAAAAGDDEGRFVNGQVTRSASPGFGNPAFPRAWRSATLKPS